MKPSDNTKRRLFYLLPWLLMLAAGAISTRLIPLPWIDPTDGYGVVPNDGLDDLAGLQAAIDAAITAKKPVVLPSGTYNISAPLWVTSTASATNAGTFYTSTLRGVGAGSGGNRTNIVPSFTDRPALAIQMAREVVIEDLAITGTNNEPTTAGTTADETYANWVDADHRDSQYSPQCGIAIDPTLGPVPADGGYPSMSYIGNTVSGSNDVFLRRVVLSNHVVGIVVRPDGRITQNDEISLDHCKISQCAIGYAICNSQSRSSSASIKTPFSYCHTAIDTLKYGGQLGQPPTILGMRAERCYRLFRLGNAGGPCTITGLYAESFKEIGIFGTGGNYGFTVIGGNFSFDFSNGRPAFMFYAGSPVKFLGGSFDIATGSNQDVYSYGGQRVSFEAVTFGLGDRVKYVGISGDTTVRSIFTNCAKRGTSGVIPLGLPTVAAQLNTYGARIEPERGTRTTVTEGGLFVYVPGSGTPHVNDSGSGYSLVGSTLTFTAIDATKYQVGDYILALCSPLDHVALSTYVPAFEVSNINGTTITATAIVDTTRIDSTPNASRIAVREWAPGQSLTGTTTSGSAVIASVSPTTIIEAGDWIKGDNGIPASARVVSINAGAATVTLNKNATASGSTHLYYGKITDIDNVPALASTAVTAAADPGTPIPAGLKHVTITSTDATHIVVLPAPVVGYVIEGYVGTNGCEFYATGSSVKINNVICSATNEAAMPATSLWTAKCVTATDWILTYRTLAGAAGATITPDSR